MFKWIKGKIKKLYEKIRFEIRLRQMDEFWYLHGGSCFGLFPPSFYYKHTQEEIARLEKEEIEKLKKIVRDFAKKHENDIEQ